MKKKTVFVLSALTLLGAGTALGVKLKQRSDFKKNLKTVVIPAAEKEVERLSKENSALNDSIVKYEDALALQDKKLALHDKKADSIHSAIKRDYSKGSYFIGCYDEPIPIEMRELVYLFQQVRDDVIGVVASGIRNTVMEIEGLTYEQFEDLVCDNEEFISEAEYCYDNKVSKDTLKLYEKLYYFNGNHSEYSPTVKNYNGKYILKHPVVMPDLPEIYYADGDHKRYYKHQDVSCYESYDIFDMVYYLEDCLLCSYMSRSVSSSNYYSVYIPKNTHAGVKLKALQAILSFVDALDNSEKLFNNKNIEALKAKAEALLPEAEKEYKQDCLLDQERENITEKRDDIANKKVAFETKREEIAKQLAGKQKQLQGLIKNSKLMKQQNVK